MNLEKILVKEEVCEKCKKEINLLKHLSKYDNPGLALRRTKKWRQEHQEEVLVTRLKNKKAAKARENQKRHPKEMLPLGMKRCRGLCKSVKLLSEFGVKSSGKPKPKCIECAKEVDRLYHISKSKNPALSERRTKKWRLEHPEEVLAEKLKREELNLQKRKERAEKVKQNKPNAGNPRRKKKSRPNPAARLRDNIRRKLRDAISHNRENGSAVEELGCTIGYLKDYFELLFYPNPVTGEMMTWDNSGEWEIDHINCLASFNLNDRTQLLKASSFLNLQPLWPIDHIKKSAEDIRKIKEYRKE